MHLVAAAAGLLLIGIIFQDAFEVMLLPRRVQRRLRFMAIYFRLAWTAWSKLGLRAQAGPSREKVLSPFGALSMLGLFVLWAAGLVLGFGLLEWSLQPTGGEATLGRAALYEWGHVLHRWIRRRGAAFGCRPARGRSWKRAPASASSPW